MVCNTIVLLFLSAAISSGQDLQSYDDFEIASAEVPCQSNWTYDRSSSNGPYCWHTIGYPICNGSEQSPINIEKDKVCYSYFSPQYDDVSNDLHGNLSNSGYAPKFSVTKTEPGYNLFNVPSRPNKIFRLKQFHMHFHENELMGSEHLINCKGYDGELHFVHHETELHACSPLTHENIVVLAVFVKKGANTHKSLKPFFQNLKYVEKCGSRVKLTLSALTFLKKLGDLYTYRGSMTNPDCREGATWLIKRKPLTVSEHDFHMLSLLMLNDQTHIIKHGNVRPAFPMNDRRVLANFETPEWDSNCNSNKKDESEKTRRECTRSRIESQCDAGLLGLE